MLMEQIYNFFFFYSFQLVATFGKVFQIIKMLIISQSTRKTSSTATLFRILKELFRNLKLRFVLQVLLI